VVKLVLFDEEVEDEEADGREMRRLSRLSDPTAFCRLT
jgi:hypothetical protein